MEYENEKKIEENEDQIVYNCYDEDLVYPYKIQPKYKFYSFISDEGSLGPIATFINKEAKAYIDCGDDIYKTSGYGNSLPSIQLMWDDSDPNPENHNWEIMP